MGQTNCILTVDAHQNDPPLEVVGIAGHRYIGFILNSNHGDAMDKCGLVGGSGLHYDEAKADGSVVYFRPWRLHCHY